ncbi:MAG: hypothetical protein DMG23_07820 [Acidobacteria bacterium]|nr:MAG: hypothetical protein DMG23_07820 [Acidobacteriota bacterium]
MGVIFPAVTHRSEGICAQEPILGAFPVPPHYGMMGHVLSPWTGGPGLFPVSRKRTKMDGNDKGELLYRRRSSRMVLRVPLLINAVDSSGEASWEQVETVVVSLHGGMVRTHQTYPVGVTLDVRRRDDERSARARVVWMSSKINSQGLDLGFEILDHPEFWGVNFPPDRRSKEASPKALRR